MSGKPIVNPYGNSHIAQSGALSCPPREQYVHRCTAPRVHTHGRTVHTLRIALPLPWENGTHSAHSTVPTMGERYTLCASYLHPKGERYTLCAACLPTMPNSGVYFPTMPPCHDQQWCIPPYMPPRMLNSRVSLLICLPVCPTVVYTSYYASQPPVSLLG